MSREHLSGQKCPENIWQVRSEMMNTYFSELKIQRQKKSCLHHMLDMESLIKYLLEGLAVAAAAFYIPRRKVNLQEIVMIAATAAAVFAVLDQFAPAVAAGTRQGAGFGIGANMVGGFEPFYSNPEEDSSSGSSDGSSEEGAGAPEPFQGFRD